MRCFPVKKNFPNLVVICFFLILLSLVYSRAAWTDEISLTPSVSITGKYNDNVSLTSNKDDRQRDWITVISPGIKFADRTERLDLALSARMEGNYYSEESDLNSWGQFYDGRIHYALTNRLGIEAHAGYLIDSTTDSYIAETGLVQPADKRKTANIGTSVDYLLGNLTAAVLSYNYENTQYAQLEENDYWGQTAGLILTHDLGRWSAATKGRLNFGYSNSHYTDNLIDSYKMTLGFSKDISAKWSILFDAGANFTQTTFSDEWGSTGQLTIAYKDLYNSGSLTVSKDVLPATNFQGAADRTAVTLTLRRYFTQEFSGFVLGSYYLNKSDAGQYSAEEIDERTALGSIGFRYDFTKDIYLEASYKYTNVEYRQDDTNAEQNLVLLTLYLQHSFFK